MDSSTDQGSAPGELSDRLLALLRCPQTRQPVRAASPALLQRVAALELCDQTGAPVGPSLKAALVREDGGALFPIRDGIPVMLWESAILLPPL